jgi:hypothetical protein
VSSFSSFSSAKQNAVISKEKVSNLRSISSYSNALYFVAYLELGYETRQDIGTYDKKVGG